jgi:hypothetical protein
LVVEIARANSGHGSSLAIEHRELPRVHLHDLGDDPGAFDGISGQLSLAGDRGQQQRGA